MRSQDKRDLPARGRRRHGTLRLSAAGTACGGLILLAACGAPYDPLTREGLWVPIHSNPGNLALMVANPADLVRGTGTVTADGQVAAAAVDRLRKDKLKALPASNISSVASSNSGENNSTGGGTGQ